MKKKIQKYLAGEREGFSLVELIIVIAIMAILIGVVTLAVLPNIAKSKESKDISALDSLLSALNNAVASQQVSTGGSFDMSISTNGEATFPTGLPAARANDQKVADATAELMGKTKITLSSAKCTKAAKIVCTWTFSGTNIGISVAVQDGSGVVVPADYLDQNFEVKN